MPLWAKVMGEEVKKHLPVEFDAQGKLSVSVNRCEDGSLLLELSNPAGTPWMGTLSFKEKLTQAVQLYPESRQMVFKNEKLHLELAPYAAVVIKVF
jgi:hypothetical protein